MFNPSKSPFKSFAAAMGLTNEDGAAASTSRRLNEMIANIENGDRLREARKQDAIARQETADEEEPPIVAVQEVADVPAEAPRGETPAASFADEFSREAQRIVAEQRKAAEQLLQETRALEERVANEVEIARAVRDHVAATERGKKAAAEERSAREAARAVSERLAGIANHRSDAEEVIATCRSGADAAKAQITELEHLLQEARRLFGETMSTIEAQEERIAQCKAQETEADRDAAEVAARVLACQSAREAAEKEARAAQERTESLRNALPPCGTGFPEIENVRTLAIRIAEQASALKRGTSGVAA